MKTKITILIILLTLIPLFKIIPQMKINPGTVIGLKTSTVLSLQGDISNLGTVNPGTSTFKFIGNGHQSLSGMSTFFNLTKSGTGDLSLLNGITVNGILNLESGKINLGSYDLEIGSSGSINHSDLSSFLNTNGTGALRQSVGNSDILFPVGNITYNPVTLRNSGIIDLFSVKVQNTFDNPIEFYKVGKQWSINETTIGGSDITIRLQWNSADEENAFNRNSYVYIQKWEDSHWIHTDSALTVNGTDPYSVTASGFTSLSPFAVVNSDIPLPVELASFTSIADRRNITLSWKTTRELNNSGFEIERSSFNSTWTKIAFVKGSGTVSEAKDYSYIDRNLSSGKYNYRLKQIDFNGNFEYFNLQNEISIGVPDKFELYYLHPISMNRMSSRE